MLKYENIFMWYLQMQDIFSQNVILHSDSDRI